ncbi:MAG: pseudouridine synthase [Candidatus Latescibacterota bacterium]
MRLHPPMPSGPLQSGEPAADGAVRLNRYLARAGVASRRASDELIRNGTVRVNGEVVSTPGVTVRPGIDRVEVDGRPALVPEGFEYVVLHKPVGCLVTRSDPGGRHTVYECVPGLRAGTVAVGRLDLDTTGLLLLTDDGELAFRLMHPRFGMGKRYEAVVLGRPDDEALDPLRRGVILDDGPTAPAVVELVRSWDTDHGWRSLVALEIHEGRKRQVRRMLRAVGHPVRELKRVAFAGMALDLPEPGQWRRLAPDEARSLRQRAGLPESG